MIRFPGVGAVGHGGRERVMPMQRVRRLASVAVVATLASQKAVEWKMAWNGMRSAPGCKSRSEVPQPGTYFATAQLADVKPVQLRMTIQD